MTRETIYLVIERERKYQDEKWPRDARRKLMYVHAAPHVLLLHQLAEDASSSWLAAKDELAVVRAIAKIATAAVRALEEIEYPRVDLLETGLR